MKKLLVFLGAFIGGTVGWYLGALVGIMTAWMISVVGTAAGVLVTRRWIDANLD